MDQAKINRFMEILSADYVKKCTAINAANAKIVELNNRADTIYNTQLAAYHTQLAIYNLKKGTGVMPIRPIPPVHKKLLPLPSGPSVPSRMTDELFNKICDVVESKSRAKPLSVFSYDNEVKCTKYIAPLLHMALNYCDVLIRENDLNDPQQILNWFMKKANQESDPNIAWYLKWICPYGKMGFPVFDDKSVMADIYHTCACGCSKLFKDVMSKFKESSGGSSSTKKWIDKVVKSLAKSSSINEKTYEKFLDKCLDNMAESLRIKAPMSISKRPTIKQKPVKEKLEAMVKKILDAKRNIPHFPRNM